MITYQIEHFGPGSKEHQFKSMDRSVGDDLNDLKWHKPYMEGLPKVKDVQV